MAEQDKVQPTDAAVVSDAGETADAATKSADAPSAPQTDLPSTSPVATADEDTAGAATQARKVQYLSDASELPDEQDQYSDATMSSLMEMYEPTLRVKEGDIVKGRVVRDEGDEVVIDIGFKSEGRVHRSEFTIPGEAAVDSEVEVYVESVEDQDGQVVISKQKADFMRVWDHIKEAYDTGKPVTGTLVRRIKGGIVVDLFGVEAFLPGSQIDLRQVKNFEQYLGKIFEFRIIKLNKNRRNIVVSRRVLLEEEREKMREELLKTLEKDQIREGIVKNITDFGAFIDLGGVDGLLHITDMSWGRINHPSEVVKIADHVRVKVLNYDRERGRISLGLKQLAQYPWEGIEKRYPVGTRVKGRVVSITDYGAFVELEQGVEGLIHISEMSWTQHIRHPSKILSVADEVECLVLRVDESNEKISLGLKQTQPDPWGTLDQRYPVGTRLVGKVRNITNFGVFVEIEEGIDGLVHISDLSWTRRIKHPSEVVRKSEELPVVIMNIDKDQRRISLSHKHCQENPWDMLEARYQPGTDTVGTVIEVTEKGLVVELEGDVEGFVPISQVGIDDVKDLKSHFHVGEAISMAVLEFDRDQKRIVLSIKRYLERRSDDEVQEYLRAHEPKPITVAEVVEGEGADTQADVPQADVPQADVPQADVPQADVPQADVPQADVPTEAPKADVPQADVPQADGSDQTTS